MLGIRVSSFTESSLGEPEQDANSALTELDKGLRSNKIGEQCEAIVRFPRLFEKYPFPILINASLLKLADVFRLGTTNFLRLCILRVCQQSEKHLDKISNVDEFVRRVYSVIHSNDPIARALTLRTLGAVAGMIPERQQVHHSIRRSLDSHDAVEVEAAIYAARQFAAQSKTFAVSMCNKISDMIQGQITPAHMKLQLIPILQYMHHDTSTAALVRQVCTDLLPTYPAQDFILVTLKTLTQLASATLVDIPSQVSLLLRYLREDPRWEVKAQGLKNLEQLASQGGHLWPPGAVDGIVDVATNTQTQKVLSLSLGVIQILTESPVTCHAHQNPETSNVRKLCMRSCYSPNLVIASQAIQVLTRILCYGYTENTPVYEASKVVNALEALILQIVNADDPKYTYQLKLCLRCAVDLCKAHKEHCAVFVELLEFQVVSADGLFNNIICESLEAIGSIEPQSLIPFFPEFLAKLEELSELDNPNITQTKVMMCTIIFQTLSIYDWRPELRQTITKVIANNNLWANYRIARSAARYGHHQVSYTIFNNLTEHVSSEHLHFWLVSLKEMSEGEAQLININESQKNSLVTQLNCAISHYNKAIAALKAASTPNHNLQFQTEYAKLRTEFLQCLVQIVHTTDSLCTVPPPAIAATIVQQTRDELQRYGYVTNQLRKSMRDFKQCAENYWKLYQSAFDADPATLENIQILQQMCGLLEQSVERTCTATTICGDQPIEFGSFVVKGRLESQQLIQSCQSVSRIAQNIFCDKQEGITGTGVTHKQMECLLKQVEIVANASLSIPRYYFQVLQSTSVKLAISPQPRVAGEFISVQSGSQLAVKVEGVIQHGKRPGLFRTVNGIIITVTSQLQSTQKSTNTDIKQPKDSSILTQTVKPHRDFFTAQFLLAFPCGGQYSLTVESSLVDERENTWRTGPKSTLTVKVPEEVEKKSNLTLPSTS